MYFRPSCSQPESLERSVVNFRGRRDPSTKPDAFKWMISRAIGNLGTGTHFYSKGVPASLLARKVNPVARYWRSRLQTGRLRRNHATIA
jgi:hypothetical protein